MKFQIETIELNKLLNIVKKGVPSRSAKLVAEYLRVRIIGNQLLITATNLVNYITVKTTTHGTEGEVIVRAKTLIELASKTTKDVMKFEKKDTYLEIKGNGTYKVELLENEEYPLIAFDQESLQLEVNVNKLKEIFSTGKSAIASELIMPCLTGFNVGEKAITTDGIKMCIMNKDSNAFSTLFTQGFADLVMNITEETAIMLQDKNKIGIYTDSIAVEGVELDGISDYPDITPLTQIEYPYHAIIPVSSTIKALDRLSLFVNEIDNNGVVLTFNEDTLSMKDTKAKSIEGINFKEGSMTSDESIQVGVNLFYLKDLLSAVKSDYVKVSYSADLPLQIVDGDTVFILGLLDIEVD